MGVRELTCCRRRGGRPLRLPVPWEPEVFLSILRERAGRLEMVSAAGRALDSAMRWDCGRRRKLRGRCCLECGCRDRQLQADEGGFRSFGEFAEISRLLWLQGEARSAGAGARRSAVCRNLQWWRRVEASLANPKPKSSLHQIGPLYVPPPCKLN